MVGKAGEGLARVVLRRGCRGNTFRGSDGGICRIVGTHRGRGRFCGCRVRGGRAALWLVSSRLPRKALRKQRRLSRQWKKKMKKTRSINNKRVLPIDTRGITATARGRSGGTRVFSGVQPRRTCVCSRQGVRDACSGCLGDADAWSVVEEKDACGACVREEEDGGVFVQALGGGCGERLSRWDAHPGGGNQARASFPEQLLQSLESGS